METDLIHRDELRCRAEAWAEDVFAGEPDNCKYNSLLHLIDDSEVVGAADVETEKLIAALRETQSLGDAPVGLFWGVIVTKELVKECIDALERLTAESAAKDAEIERLKEQVQYNHDCYFSEFAEKNRLQAELDAAKKCVNDVQTYLDLGSAKYIAATIKQWRGKENGDGKENS